MPQVHEYAVCETTEAEPPRYTVYVEPAEGQALPPPAAAAAALDAALADESVVYRTWRGKRAIGPPEVVHVAKGGFEALRGVRIRDEGASPQQLKVSRVLRQPRHAEILRRGTA